MHLIMLWRYFLVLDILPNCLVEFEIENLLVGDWCCGGVLKPIVGFYSKRGNDNSGDYAKMRGVASVKRCLKWSLFMRRLRLMRLRANRDASASFTPTFLFLTILFFLTNHPAAANQSKACFKFTFYSRLYS